ncbi:alpha/beta hydrolase family protein [Lacimicrobium alkaliphilum]|uniref:alpha/beta hydrolase family protein n=1 Tax=Lacimicrobium alkaliphilum TaxID=1526571 RepID=UPI0015D505E8|nr:prolyl oligopeptidase family serine peptidase [Lacimicrobium alkaliphilum]
MLKQYSPINHVDKIKARVMLIHGAQDKRTPEVSAQKLQDKLKQAGNAPVYLRFRQSGHGVYDETSRSELYEGLLAFLGEHIGV